MKAVTKNIKKDHGHDVGGYYNILTNTISLNNNNLTEKIVRKVLLHEIQHKIQKIEKLEIGKTNSPIRYYTSLGELMSSEVENRANMSYAEIRQKAPEISKEYPIHPYLKKANDNINSKFAKELLQDKNVENLYDEIYNIGNKGEYNRVEINKKGYIQNQKFNNKGIFYNNGRRGSNSGAKQKSIQIKEGLDDSSFSLEQQLENQTFIIKQIYLRLLHMM